MRRHFWHYFFIYLAVWNIFNVANADIRMKDGHYIENDLPVGTQLPVQVCSESWAPFYYEAPQTPSAKNANKQASSKVVGVNIDILEAAANQHQYQFQYKLMPHKRCLHNSQKFGHERQFEITTDATYSEEKAKEFYFIGPIYSLSRAIFYSKDEFPKGLFNPMSGHRLTTLREMKHFEVCEADGRVIENYIEKHTHIDDEIVLLHKAGLNSMLMMLNHGRCEIMEIPAPIVAGSITAGEITIPDNIACQTLNEEHVKFYFLVSRRSPRAEQLVTNINQTLISLKQSGRYDEIVKRYYDELYTKNSHTITDCF
ncbi:transporter substrate-binding domain-containing protein [Vibrio sp. S9_S30]|uniref:substrate-binding periplasmic protein n=1 Tax=Vibrio sp. S9_S30 TaxID=2720226 RepID=UPI001680F89D|nr:transporter substrate-binding domain-containing protein [Vibrio sp. S9_S30]MBD1557638.1 transporter substrate-binding domain-containing protein [Vibrio sp. S9_S30]